MNCELKSFYKKHLLSILKKILKIGVTHHHLQVKAVDHKGSTSGWSTAFLGRS
ncbi:hypothetical protein B0H99_10789 [Planomicrobium soli]|uniref:Uncharacterized protein n=1 Tax=Planomicrobium soli TaxID=1176648 RepID=A0A2P8GQM9_9BACL|nr:hypothetical protein B0H99_10789 [Planomicrobium soli]